MIATFVSPPLYDHPLRPAPSSVCQPPFATQTTGECKDCTTTLMNGGINCNEAPPGAVLSADIGKYPGKRGCPLFFFDCSPSTCHSACQSTQTTLSPPFYMFSFHFFFPKKVLEVRLRLEPYPSDTVMQNRVHF